jgi:hypothetical protein
MHMHARTAVRRQFPEPQPGICADGLDRSISYSHRLSHPIHLGGLMRRCGSQVGEIDSRRCAAPTSGGSIGVRGGKQTKELEDMQVSGQELARLLHQHASVAVTSPARTYVGDKIPPVAP